MSSVANLAQAMGKLALKRSFLGAPGRRPARAMCWTWAAGRSSSTAGCFKGSGNFGCGTTRRSHNRDGYSKHRPALPLYIEADAELASRPATRQGGAATGRQPKRFLMRDETLGQPRHETEWALRERSGHEQQPPDTERSEGDHPRRR